MDLPLDAVPAPDLDVVPGGFVVLVEAGERIHFLDWGGPTRGGAPGVLLIHGLSQTAWTWTPVARRVCRATRTVAMDIRGHGLSDAPTGGYEPSDLATDVVAVAEGSGLLAGSRDRVVLAGHGFGAVVASWAALELGSRCAGLVLVDGGWEDLEDTTGMDADEFLRGLDEPPEVMRSMTDFLADRAAFDPGSWDADQERAARATVVETHAGRVVPATRPHALEACVGSMFAHRPIETLTSVDAPIVALISTDEAGERGESLRVVSDARLAGGRAPIGRVAFPGVGHNLMRYRPVEVSASIVGIADSSADQHA